MLSFSHVREVERSDQHCVIEETARMRAALLFGALGLLTIVAFRRAENTLLALWFGSWSLYSSVRSSFIADRRRGVLVVRRRVLTWSIERVYESATIDRIYVRGTMRGSGLAIRFTSGRSKNLTMSLGSGTGLEAVAGALNHFLYAPHRG